jgi:glycosyltransferase involved in cell wall biosynthesis
MGQTAEKTIAFLSKPYHKGGVTRWVVDLAVFMSNMPGWKVYFLVIEPTHPFNIGDNKETALDLLKKQEHKLIMETVRCGYEFEFGGRPYIVDVYRNLMLRLPQGTPIVIADTDVMWEASASVAHLYPIIPVAHGDYGHYYDLMKKYANEFSLFVGVSNRIRDTFLANNPNVPKERAVAIPCGTPLPEFRPVKTQGDGVVRLVFLGRFEAPEKRAADLIAISELLHRKGIAFHLDIIGNSVASEKTFGDLFKEKGLRDFVTFNGWQSRPQIEDILFASDILLLNSNYEGFPLVLMEAMACGCGFIGTRVSGVEDYEFDPRGQDCLRVYTVGDFDDVVQKIEELSAVPKATRATAARALAEAEFSLEVCANKYATALDRLTIRGIKARPYNFPLTHKVKSYLIGHLRGLKFRLRKAR